PNQPGRVAAAVLEALEEEDVARACELMDAKMHDDKPGGRGAYDCEQSWLHIDNTPWSWKPTPGAVSEWGTPDVVVKHVYYGDEGTAVVIAHRRGGTLRREVELRNEGGRWLVSRVESPI
ncbi:MAG TPA: hypothetical protein VG518_08045, partial [Solirubrobacterales bacterium]|nr:hypothetical protein [Solirubrobacterales bacterium]